MPDLEPFAVEVQRRDHVTIVRPRGELDIATVERLRTGLDAAIAETLHATLDGIETAARLVLDLRGLSFIDSTGLHLLVALDQRAQRDGFVLTLVAPARSDRQSDRAVRARPVTAVRGAGPRRRQRTGQGRERPLGSHRLVGARRGRPAERAAREHRQVVGDLPR